MIIIQLSLFAALAAAVPPPFEASLIDARAMVLQARAEESQAALNLLRLRLSNTADFAEDLDARAFRLWKEIYALAGEAKAPPADFQERLKGAGAAAANLESLVRGLLNRTAGIAEITPRDSSLNEDSKRLSRATSSLRTRCLDLTRDTGWDLSLHETASKAWKGSEALDGKAAVIASRVR